MKNITVSVDYSVHQRARLRAAERNTSLSALVKGFLENLAGDESEAQHHRRLRNEVLQHLDTLRQRGLPSPRACEDHRRWLSAAFSKPTLCSMR